MAQEKTSTFGTCGFQRTSPPVQDLSGQTDVLNIHISFEEALKLNLALYLQKGRIAVNEGKLVKV